MLEISSWREIVWGNLLYKKFRKTVAIDEIARKSLNVLPKTAWPCATKYASIIMFFSGRIGTDRGISLFLNAVSHGFNLISNSTIYN